MSKTDDCVLGCIETWVWSGFYGLDDIQEMIGDVLERDADEAMLRAAVESELAAKATAEKTWLRVTGAASSPCRTPATRCPTGAPTWAERVADCDRDQGKRLLHL